MGKITKQSQITLVELPATQFGVLNGDLSGDIYSRIRVPSRALGVLESVLRDEGWHHTQSINPLFDETNGKLDEISFRRIFSSDVLGISSITRTSPQSLELAKRYHDVNPEGVVIFGGSDSKFRAVDYLQNGGDIVVMGEGEKTILEVIERLEKSGDLSRVKGIAHKRNGEIVVEQERRLLSSDELSNLPHPVYDESVRDQALAAVVETTRGCPHDCDFCTVTRNYGNAYRTKSIKYSIEEL